MTSIAKVPAWKRLGLQLKSATPGASTSEPTIANEDAGKSISISRYTGNHTGPSYLGKRRAVTDAPATQPYTKIPRRGDHDFNSAGTDRYTPKETSNAQYRPHSATNTNTTVAPSTSKKTTESPSQKLPRLQQAPPAFKFGPALTYLRQWRDDRPSWKFSKNYQTLLTKYVLSIPASDVDTFYDYIRDLQGFGRTRLREVAIRERDEDKAAGIEGFGDNAATDADEKQARYEVIVSKFIGAGKTKRKPFKEAKFLVKSGDDQVSKRVVKRMRAELIAEALADGPEDEQKATFEAPQGGVENSVAQAKTETDPKTSSKPNDQRKVPRPRKSRTAMIESSDESSSESSSADDVEEEPSKDKKKNEEGEEDSSTSSSSSDEAGEEIDEEDDDETSSSSSSSSSEADHDDGHDSRKKR